MTEVGYKNPNRTLLALLKFRFRTKRKGRHKLMELDVMRITDARGTSSLILLFLVLLCAFCQGCTNDLGAKEALLAVNAASKVGQKIPETLFGVFFEEINHAGAGGLWAELVNNRGFEAGGQNVPSNIEPWSVIGNDSNIIVETDCSSCFANNKIALRMDVLCDENGENSCPAGGVGVYNPGFWGMNIEQGQSYKVILHVKSLQSSCISVSLTSPYGSQVLASKQLLASACSDWNKVEFLLEANSTNRKSRLQLTTNNKGTVWFDQVSVMPADTHKGHGFRKDLFSMVADLKPAFIRFPGGCFVEGEWLRNAFRWRETVGPWEERPGHFGDVWMYWSDDGLGYYEYLILAEDLDTIPIWVFNNGISHNDEVDPSSIAPFVQDVLDSIEFARGDPNTKWGAVRAKMGHPDPFPLKYVAIGNEDCWKKNYLANYLKFYYAIRHAYPDIKMISNCDGSSRPLDHPADLYDFHIYTSASSMFSTAHKFDHVSRKGPKAFVSEYAVTNKADAGNGTFVAALAEAAFLIGLERNSDIVVMASYAPLFVNTNDRRWNPDAIVFDSWQNYGTPSYWMQHFFKESNGAIYHPVSLYSNNSNSLVASAITWKRAEDDSNFLRIKIVNFGADPVNFKISLVDLENDLNLCGSTIRALSTITILSGNLKDENSFDEPNKVIPVQDAFDNAGENMIVNIKSYSLTAIDLSLAQEVTHSHS